MILPALTLMGGGALGSRFHPGHRLRGMIAHLVGGLVLGTAAADLMPAASRSGHPLALALGFSLGFSLLLVINAVLKEPELPSTGERARPLAILLLPFLVDSLIDGLVVGISSEATSNGWIIPIAVALEMGLAALGVGTLLGRGAGRWRSSLAGVLMGLTYLLGLGVSQWLGDWLRGSALTGLLAFGTAALIYLVVEEVMKEAHADGEDDSGVVNLAFFIGLLVVWLLDSVQA
ncbi:MULTISPECIES: ZIP family metal transporter [unclassified Synechococcus]|uniref:ZIP family metal transporter n=1 Tax=unclassified Synechococcus TaxID=2626047 RepID=UPI0005680DC4|nr:MULTISPECIES: membrane protein [unclassified Synechococcus]